MYKKAAQLKLRFQTSKGFLSTEDLFGLSLNSLKNECRAQLKRMKDAGFVNSEELSFLEDDVKSDPTEELKFEILKDVYKTKKAEAEAAKNKAANNVEKQRILAILKKKQDASLEAMSEEELKKKLAELD